MNKILGYIAVFLIFSWVSTANAGPVATITDSSGQLTITGFNPLLPVFTPGPVPNDGNPATMEFAFDFTPGSSGMVTFFNTINAGQSYNGSASFNLTGLGAAVAGNPFTANFVATMLSPATLGPLGPMTVDAFLAANAPPPTFNVTGSMSTIVNNIPVSLTLDSASITENMGNYILTLKATETGALNLSAYLNCLDGWAPPGTCQGASIPGSGGYRDGSVSSSFENANATIPEPTTLLLLGSGLLGVFGFSRKRA